MHRQCTGQPVHVHARAYVCVVRAGHDAYTYEAQNRGTEQLIDHPTVAGWPREHATVAACFAPADQGHRHTQLSFAALPARARACLLALRKTLRLWDHAQLSCLKRDKKRS